MPDEPKAKDVEMLAVPSSTKEQAEAELKAMIVDINADKVVTPEEKPQLEAIEAKLTELKEKDVNMDAFTIGLIATRNEYNKIKKGQESAFLQEIREQAPGLPEGVLKAVKYIALLSSVVLKMLAKMLLKMKPNSILGQILLSLSNSKKPRARTIHERMLRVDGNYWQRFIAGMSLETLKITTMNSETMDVRSETMEQMVDIVDVGAKTIEQERKNRNLPVNDNEFENLVDATANEMATVKSKKWTVALWQEKVNVAKDKIIEGIRKTPVAPVTPPPTPTPAPAPAPGAAVPIAPAAIPAAPAGPATPIPTP